MLSNKLRTVLALGGSDDRMDDDRERHIRSFIPLKEPASRSGVRNADNRARIASTRQARVASRGPCHAHSRCKSCPPAVRRLVSRGSIEKLRLASRLTPSSTWQFNNNGARPLPGNKGLGPSGTSVGTGADTRRPAANTAMPVQAVQELATQVSKISLELRVR
jgi:hypothetical protein